MSASHTLVLRNKRFYRAARADTAQHGRHGAPFLQPSSLFKHAYNHDADPVTPTLPSVWGEMHFSGMANG
ncbi:uncharacterized [Tachysurus ichikawai]